MSSSPNAYPWTPLEDREACCVPETFIETENLSLYYREKPAFKNVSLSVSKGCITSLVGPSGCGKTSFLGALNRLSDLIPGCRVEGSIRLGRQDLRSGQTDVPALRRRVGMIFQKPNPFPLSIRRNLEFPLKEHGVRNHSEIEDKTARALTDVGLWKEVQDRLDTPALALSGGQQQRLCIARALCLNPEVLLMDEPCSALDPLSSATIEDLITSLRGRYTVIIVTHNLAQARRISDYAACFWVRDGAGFLVESAPAKELFEHPRDEITAAYIGGVRG
jgi:phosphate transport system ATP-binding protein